MMNNIDPKIKRILYGFGGLVVLSLVGYIFYLGLQSQGNTATLDIQSTVPNDPTITIDAKKVSANGKVNVTPGKHTVAAKRNGFYDKTTDVTVKMGETQKVQIIMNPSGDVGYQWLRDHPDLATQWEAVIGHQFDQNSQNTTTRNPLISYLPMIRPTWRIDYGVSEKHPTDPTAVTITITYGGAEIDKQNALQWIKDQGFNPSDYDIVFKLPPQAGN